MKKTAKKMLKTGFGLGLLSISQAKKAAAYAKKELNLNEEESLRLARELVSSSEKVSKEMLKVVEKNLTTALVKTKLVKKKKLSRVRKVVKKKLSGLKAKKKKSVKKKASRKKK